MSEYLTTEDLDWIEQVTGTAESERTTLRLLAEVRRLRGLADDETAVERAARADFASGVLCEMTDEDMEADTWDGLSDGGKALLLDDARAALRAALGQEGAAE